MKTVLNSIVLSILAVTLYAGPIDGKWRAETKLEGKSKRAGTTVTTTFDLKASDGKLTGSVSTGRGKRNKTAEIQNGKIEGDRFTFTTVRKTKKGEKTISGRVPSTVTSSKGRQATASGRLSSRRRKCLRAVVKFYANFSENFLTEKLLTG
jgi:hypothetical protein